MFTENPQGFLPSLYSPLSVDVQSLLSWVISACTRGRWCVWRCTSLCETSCTKLNRSCCPQSSAQLKAISYKVMSRVAILSKNIVLLVAVIASQYAYALPTYFLIEAPSLSSERVKGSSLLKRGFKDTLAQSGKKKAKEQAIKLVLKKYLGVIVFATVLAILLLSGLVIWCCRRCRRSVPPPEETSEADEDPNSAI